MGIIIFVGISCVLFLADIVIKHHVEEHMDDEAEKDILNGKVLIRKVHNKGMMLNALEKHPDAVKKMSGTAGILLAVYNIFLLLRKGRILMKTGIAFMMSGAWSNIYDRWVRGYVVDYFGFQTKWKKLSNITFNLGDMFIFFGGLLIMTASLFRKKNG